MISGLVPGLFCLSSVQISACGLKSINIIYHTCRPILAIMTEKWSISHNFLPLLLWLYARLWGGDD
jgi:hypothetical protein